MEAGFWGVSGDFSPGFHVVIIMRLRTCTEYSVLRTSTVPVLVLSIPLQYSVLEYSTRTYRYGSRLVHHAVLVHTGTAQLWPYISTVIVCLRVDYYNYTRRPLRYKLNLRM